jgi:two-component system phosphate regulon sensor histidine kinase PhoR
VNKILNFSQIENDKRKYVFAKTNLNNVVNEVVNTFKYHLEDKNFELQLELDNEIPQIMADSEALTDSLVNLVDNAIKYSGDQKFLGIKTGQQKDGVFIEIKDNGIGISESDQKKIFEKFYRVTEKNLAYKAKGSGLGLSIVKHVIDKHNGKINIKSKVGSGTSFRLIFPLEK